ncbi:MAG: hypothetical protein Q9182_006732 [Xanthomendoza sp. 2 TL-2023]
MTNLRERNNTPCRHLKRPRDGRLVRDPETKPCKNPCEDRAYHPAKADLTIIHPDLAKVEGAERFPLAKELPTKLHPGIDGQEEYANQFTQALDKAIRLSTKKTTIKPKYSNADFDQQCGEINKETIKGKKILIGISKVIRDHSKPCHENHPDITAVKEKFTAIGKNKHLVRKITSQAYKVAMASTVTDPDKICKISKWAKRNRNLYLYITPVNLKLTDDTKITTKAGKAEALARAFSPTPPEADLDETTNYQQPTPIDMLKITKSENPTGH